MAIGHDLRGGEVITLTGELGAGKTCFVRGLAKGPYSAGASQAVLGRNQLQA